MRRLFGIAAALVAAVALSGCIIGDFVDSDRYQSDFRYSYDLPAGGRINLENSNGSVEVTGWDRDKVEITGVKYASSQSVLDSLKIEIRNEPGFIDIRFVRPAEPFTNAGARFVLSVPRTAALDRIGTSNGAIRVANMRSAIDARTTNGAVDIHGIQGRVSVKTSNGRIRAEDIDGQCEARTSNGSIDLTFLHAPKSDIRAQTSNGSITVRLPADTAARLKADTTNSSITSELDVTTHVEGNDRRLHHLDGTIGAGGPLIELGTRNGRISLLRN